MSETPRSTTATGNGSPRQLDFTEIFGERFCKLPPKRRKEEVDQARDLCGSLLDEDFYRALERGDKATVAKLREQLFGDANKLNEVQRLLNGPVPPNKKFSWNIFPKTLGESPSAASAAKFSEAAKRSRRASEGASSACPAEFSALVDEIRVRSKGSRSGRFSVSSADEAMLMTAAQDSLNRIAGVDMTVPAEHQGPEATQKYWDDRVSKITSEETLGDLGAAARGMVERIEKTGLSIRTDFYRAVAEAAQRRIDDRTPGRSASLLLANYVGNGIIEGEKSALDFVLNQVRRPGSDWGKEIALGTENEALHKALNQDLAALHPGTLLWGTELPALDLMSQELQNVSSPETCAKIRKRAEDLKRKVWGDHKGWDWVRISTELDELGRRAELRRQQLSDPSAFRDRFKVPPGSPEEFWKALGRVPIHQGRGRNSGYNEVATPSANKFLTEEARKVLAGIVPDVELAALDDSSSGTRQRKWNDRFASIKTLELAQSLLAGAQSMQKQLEELKLHGDARSYLGEVADAAQRRVADLDDKSSRSALRRFLRDEWTQPAPGALTFVIEQMKKPGAKHENHDGLSDEAFVKAFNCSLAEVCPGMTFLYSYSVKGGTELEAEALRKVTDAAKCAELARCADAMLQRLESSLSADERWLVDNHIDAFANRARQRGEQLKKGTKKSR
jgi:hypothetical protein